jgi:hypothetical protein
MKTKSLLILFMSCVFSTSAQNIGYFFDLHGNHIGPRVNLTMIHQPDLISYADYHLYYIPGDLHYKNGLIIREDLNQSNGKLFKLEGELIQKIDLTELDFVRIGCDTFRVYKNSRFDDNRKGYSLGKTLVQIGPKSLIQIKKKVYLKEGEKWTDLYALKSKIKELTKFLKTTFSDIPPVTTRIEISYKDIPKIFKYAKYYSYFEEDRKVIVDYQFLESHNSSYNIGFLRINNVKDSIWNISFFDQDSILTETANVSDIFTFKYNGTRTLYHVNKQPALRGLYINGYPRRSSFKYFYSNGEPFAELTFNRGKMSFEYSKVYKTNGDTIDISKEAKVQFKDPINSTTISHSFKSNRIDYIRTNDGVVRSLNKYLFRTTIYNVNGMLFKGYKYPDRALAKGISGPVVLKIKTNPDGSVNEAECLNNAPNELKDPLISHLKDRNRAFKTVKIDKEKCMTEFIFTAYYSLEQNPNDSVFYDHDLFQQYLMMQHPIQYKTAPTF